MATTLTSSGQKFIARNRAPRVQIEYDVEIYGAERKVQLPFVMGVLADLAGRSDTPQPDIGERKFLNIDIDNFDERMKSIRPRAAFQVANTLTGEGNLNVDITFESIDDFSPATVARKVGPLNELLNARTQLANLLGKVLEDPALLNALAAAPRPADATQDGAADGDGGTRAVRDAN